MNIINFLLTAITHPRSSERYLSLSFSLSLFLTTHRLFTVYCKPSERVARRRQRASHFDEYVKGRTRRWWSLRISGKRYQTPSTAVIRRYIRQYNMRVIYDYRAHENSFHVLCTRSTPRDFDPRFLRLTIAQREIDFPNDN